MKPSVFLFFFILSFTFGTLLSSCAGPKALLEHTLAKAALDAAKNAEANRYAPKLWTKAKRSYKEALKKNRQNKNKKAKIQFNEARLYAEKAERRTLIKKSKSTDTPL